MRQRLTFILPLFLFLFSAMSIADDLAPAKFQIWMCKEIESQGVKIPATLEEIQVKEKGTLLLAEYSPVKDKQNKWVSWHMRILGHSLSDHMRANVAEIRIRPNYRDHRSEGFADMALMGEAFPLSTSSYAEKDLLWNLYPGVNFKEPSGGNYPAFADDRHGLATMYISVRKNSSLPYTQVSIALLCTHN
jgi:hypothetical protein